MTGISPRLSYVLKNILLALVCLPIARLGLLFAFERANVSLVWPMTGVALAVLLLLGWEYWPSMALAVLAHNLINQTPILPSVGIAIGSTATCLVAVYFLQRRLRFRLSLERATDVLGFATFGAILATTVSAVIGVGCLYLAGLVPPQNYLFDVFTWWIGDAMGVLVVTPVLLIWSRVPLKFSNTRKLIEASGLILLLLGVCFLIFSQGMAPRSFYPLAYLIFPFLIWAALRFDQRMVVSLTLLVALIAVLQTGQQFGNYNQSMIWNSILFLWAYIATMAITSMLLAATLAERRQIEQTVRSLEQRFSKAFHAAPVAIWISTVEEGTFIDVNEEFCLMMGYERDEVIGQSSQALNIWETPDVRTRLLTVLEMQGRVSQVDIHLRPRLGERRYGLLSTDMIELDGEPHLLNMFHDLTERFQTEEALRDSQERYRQLFEGIDDTIFVHDLEANILDVNEAATRHLGYTREELLRMKVTDLDVPEFAAGFAERLQQQLAQGFLNNIEGRQITKDGREIVFDVSTKLISYKGKPAVLGVDRDVTERKQAEQQLRESEARYRAVVEDQSELICRFTPDFILTFVNDAYCNYFNRKREDLIGKPFMPSIHTDDQAVVTNLLSSLTAANPVVTSENRAYMPDGSVRWHQWRDHAITDEHGQVIEYQSVGKDITEVKELEKQRLAMELERERVEILADFIVAASHDFRTPLSVINTSAYLLNRIAEPEQRERHFKQIQEQTYHIEQLVDGLLTMSRLDRGDVFRFKTVDLNGMVQQIEVRERGQLTQKRLEMKLELDRQLPLIDGDEGWLYHCIVQLVDNAIHYTPEGGLITLRTQAQTDQVLIAVTDTGIGIRPDDLPHIFKRLYRGEEHRPVGGQGLGLSIAAKIVEAHEGNIEVESATGAGSTFRILLPLKQSDTSVESSPSL